MFFKYNAIYGRKDEENRNYLAWGGSFLILFLKIVIDP